MSFQRNNIPATVVVRSNKSRPSVMNNSVDKGVMELNPEVSPSTSGEGNSNSSGKQAAPPNTRTNSTGMTSLDSKFSAGMKMLSGHSSGIEPKKGLAGAMPRQFVPEETVVNNVLTPISENAQEVHIEPVPVPSRHESYPYHGLY